MPLSGSKGTVLLVNDDPDVLFLWRNLLTLALPHCRLREATDAATALGLAEDPAVVAIVTDMKMQPVDGVAMVRALRAKGSRLPIVMVSGMENRRAEAMEAGVSEFLTADQWVEIAGKVSELV